MTALTRGHLGRTWTGSRGMITIKCQDGDFETGSLPPAQARIVFRQHRKDMGEVVAPVRTRVTFHLGDTVSVPWGTRKLFRLDGVVISLHLTKAGPLAHVQVKAGDDAPSVTDPPLSELALMHCPHTGWTDGLSVMQVTP